jgi:hypothetical protein
MTVQISAYILLMKTELLSETTLFDTPNLEMTLSTKLSARSSALQVFSAGIYRDIFEKRSTITRIASYTALLFLLGGRSVMKFMEISCHGPSGTGNGCSTP